MAVQIVTILSAIFDIAWLGAVLFLLWRIWRTGVRREICMQQAIENSTAAMKANTHAIELLTEAQTGKATPNQ